MSRIISILIILICSLPLSAITSPNGKFSITDKNQTELEISYHSSDKKIPLLSLLCGSVSETGEPLNVKVRYDMVTGKKSHCENEYNEQKYVSVTGDTIIFRLYNDGAAWKKSGSSDISLLDPKHLWIQEWTDSYENYFPKDRKLEDKRYGYPALMEYDDSIFALLTESGITPTEAGTSMYYSAGTSYPYRFSLRPDGEECGGWQTLIAGSLNEVVESTLVTDNSQPSTIDDTTWIQPGVASWVYWANNHGSNDYEIIKKYTDLAAELRLPYIMIDAEWDEMKNGKTIEDAVEYALNSGIKPLIWYNSSVGWVNGAPGPKFRLNTPESMEKEFAWCDSIGVKGLKIDFFSGDTNSNFKFMSELLECAARHHQMINFHGSPLPRGWQRTYPNFVTTESVYGAEWYNNTSKFTNRAASHNATLPFTRNVIGSMDYTPCAFTDSQHPHITTDAHELALTALFESGIQHLADRPESFLSQPQPVKDYLSSLPTAWDESRLISGYPGEYVIMARRKGNDWWISAINGLDKPLDAIRVDLSRLNIGNQKLSVTLFEDKENGKGWKISTLSSVPSHLNLLPRGGAVMVIRNTASLYAQ